jgi:hypothetical protein
MHRHGDKVGESLVIEDGKQTVEDHLDEIHREWNLSRFELGYWDASPPGYSEMFGKPMNSNDQELEKSDEMADIGVFRGQFFERKGITRHQEIRFSNETPDHLSLAYSSLQRLTQGWVSSRRAETAWSARSARPRGSFRHVDRLKQLFGFVLTRFPDKGI